MNDRKDILFMKILEDEQFASAFDIDASKYRSTEDGKKDLHNAKVRAVAEIVEQMSKKIGVARSNMNTAKKTGAVKLPDADFKPIYDTVISLLSKQG